MTYAFYIRALAFITFSVSLCSGMSNAATIRTAGADIGTKGIRAVVVESDETGVRVLFKRLTNPTTGLLKDGKLVPGAVSDTTDDLKEFVRIFTNDYKIPLDEIKLVGSSSLAALKDREELAKAVFDKTNVKMSFLSGADEEARLTIGGLALLGNRARGLLIDVWSVNAKGGAVIDEKLQSFGVPFGTVSLAAKALDLQNAKKISFREALATVRQTDLLPAVQKAFVNKSSLRNQQHVTLTGGISYAVATLLHPEQAKSEVVNVTLADFRALTAMLAKDPLQFPAVDLKSIPDDVRKQATDDVNDVKRLFSVENLLSGSTVAIAIGTEMQLDEKQLTFVRGAQYAWIVGYLAPQKEIGENVRKGPPPYEPKKGIGENVRKGPPPYERKQEYGSRMPSEPLPMGVSYFYAPWISYRYSLPSAGCSCPIYGYPIWSIYAFPTYYPCFSWYTNVVPASCFYPCCVCDSWCYGMTQWCGSYAFQPIVVSWLAPTPYASYPGPSNANPPTTSANDRSSAVPDVKAHQLVRTDTIASWKALPTNRLYGDALTNYWDGRYEIALDMFWVLVETEPSDARFWYFKALTERALGDSTSAKISAQRGAALELVDSNQVSIVFNALERIQGASRVFLREAARDIDGRNGAQMITSLPLPKRAPARPTVEVASVNKPNQ